MTATEELPDWLASDDPQVVWKGAMCSLDEALVHLNAPTDHDLAGFVVPRAAASSAGFAFLDREGFASVGGVVMATLAEVTYALLRAAGDGTPEDVEAAALGLCCVLGVDAASLSP